MTHTDCEHFDRETRDTRQGPRRSCRDCGADLGPDDTLDGGRATLAELREQAAMERVAYGPADREPSPR